MKLSHRLEKAKGLISNPADWCRGSLHVYVGNTPVQHCAVGACEHVAGEAGEGFSVTVDALHKASAELGFTRNVVKVNDEYGHSPIMMVFDRAIQTAKFQEMMADIQAKETTVEITEKAQEVELCAQP